MSNASACKRKSLTIAKRFINLTKYTNQHKYVLCEAFNILLHIQFISSRKKLSCQANLDSSFTAYFITSAFEVNTLLNAHQTPAKSWGYKLLQ